MRVTDTFRLDFTNMVLNLSRLQPGEPKTPSSGTSNDTVSSAVVEEKDFAEN